jgi:hypothetical protein
MKRKLLIALIALTLYACGFWTAQSLLHFQVEMTCKHITHGIMST